MGSPYSSDFGNSVIRYGFLDSICGPDVSLEGLWDVSPGDEVSYEESNNYMDTVAGGVMDNAYPRNTVQPGSSDCKNMDTDMSQVQVGEIT